MLPPAMMEQLRTRHVDTHYYLDRVGYGCGLVVERGASVGGYYGQDLCPWEIDALAAGGALEGAGALLEVVPARRFAVVVVTNTGQSLLCEDVLLESGVSDLSVYNCVPGAELGVDLWVDTPNPPGYTGP